MNNLVLRVLMAGLVLLVASACGPSQADLDAQTTQAAPGAPAAPHGGQIAFASERDGNWEIYVMNTDGSDVTRLTDDPAVDGVPAWSRDGARIVFSSHRDGNLEVYVMNADGSYVTRLTDNPAHDLYPAWQPQAAHVR